MNRKNRIKLGILSVLILMVLPFVVIVSLFSRFQPQRGPDYSTFLDDDLSIFFKTTPAEVEKMLGKPCGRHFVNGELQRLEFSDPYSDTRIKVEFTHGEATAITVEN